tara:strand:+ start:244 stop:702 length:459 start_codon:yes stop_codon:yes gene_type:complete
MSAKKRNDPMHLHKLLIGLATLFFATSGMAETFEVKMMNKSTTGKMVFEPAYLAIAPGDTVTFIPESKGHNAETIKGMIPAGVKPFKSKIGKEFSVTLTAQGLYGIKCMPHYNIGMVALIQVGAAKNLDKALTVKHKGKAKARFKLLFEKAK